MRELGVGYRRGRRLFRVLAEVAQTGSDGADPGAVQQAEGGVAQHGDHRRPLSQMHLASVFAQGHILGPMQPVLDAPVAALQRQQPVGGPDLGWQAGDPVAHLALGLAVLAPDALHPEDLGRPRPVQVAAQVDRGNQVAHLVLPPMPPHAGARLAAVVQGRRAYGPRWVEQPGNILVEGGLVLLDQQQGVAPGSQYLLTQVALAEERIAGQINARGFAEVVGGEVARLQRYRHPFSLAYLDLDDFKTINDRLGHRAGDVVLRTVAVTLRRSLRPSDVVARLGGDEFAILLPETDAAAAQAVLERVRTTLVLVGQEQDGPVTASIGLLTCRRPAAVEEVLERADRLMYAGKRQGKNQVQQEVINGSRPSRP